MRKVSKKKAGISARISRIFRDKKERNGNRCFLSGSSYRLTPAHIIRQSHSIALQDNPRNIIPLDVEVHEMFDNGKFKVLLERYPFKCMAIIERMRSLDFFYTNRFLRNNKLEHLIQ